VDRDNLCKHASWATNTPRGKLGHQTKRRKILHDGLDNTSLNDEYQSSQLHPPGLHLKRRASNGIAENVPGNAVVRDAKRRKIGRDDSNDVSMKGKATGVQQQEPQDGSSMQHRGSETESDDISVNTILQQERDRRQDACDGDGDLTMGGVIPTSEQVGRGDFEQEGTIHLDTAISSQLETNYNDGASRKLEKHNTDSPQGDNLISINKSNLPVDVLKPDKKAARGRRSSQHGVPSHNINNGNNNTKSANKGEDEVYDESVRVDVKSFYTKREDYFRFTTQDPESFQDAEARVEGKMRIKGHTMISFDPIPRENGRPRRYYAFKNSFIPMDPQDIQKLQTGTRDELKRLERGAVPEGACYMILTSHTYKWAGFLGSFGQRKDPSKPTWFPVTECLPRFQANFYIPFVWPFILWTRHCLSSE
jgi:hypothetical protein